MDPRQHHYLEPGTATEIVHAIQSHAERVWRQLEQPGHGVLNCIPASAQWYEALCSSGIGCHMLVGWYVVDDEDNGDRPGREHVFLAVGDESSLFDPTAGQFPQPPRVANYLVKRREYSYEYDRFPDWRAARPN